MKPESDRGIRENRGLALAALCESPTGSDL